jgi:hypothetical protein
MQHTLAAANGIQNQSLAGLKIASCHVAAIPMQHIDRLACHHSTAYRHQRGGAGTRQAGKQQVYQSQRQLGIVVGGRDHFGDSTEHVDMWPDVAKRNIVQILGAKRLLFDGSGHIQRNVDSFVRQREGGGTDDEMLAHSDLKRLGRQTLKEDRIACFWNPPHRQSRTVPGEFRMAAGNAIVPGGRPGCPYSAQDDAAIVGERPPPAIVRVGSLCDQISHAVFFL